MAFKIKNDKKMADPIPADAHVGLCYLLVDLGTQHNAQYDTDRRKIVLGFELPDVKGKRADGTEYRRTIARRFTASMHEKSVLRGVLERWRGKKFSEDELAGFDLCDVLGKAALITVVHENAKSGDGIFSNIDSIGPVPKLLNTGGGWKLESPIVYYSMEEHGMNIPESIPEWMRKVIQESKEWKGEIDSAQQEVDPATHSPAAGDEIPF